jgi:hypothetical protein
MGKKPEIEYILSVSRKYTPKEKINKSLQTHFKSEDTALLFARKN